MLGTQLQLLPPGFAVAFPEKSISVVKKISWYEKPTPRTQAETNLGKSRILLVIHLVHLVLTESLKKVLNAEYPGFLLPWLHDSEMTSV